MDIVVEGAKPYDGRYELIKFNRREQGQIRRLAGWMPLEYEDALKGGDAEFIACLAVLSMRRAGRIELDDVPDVYGRLLDMDDAEITLEGDQEEAEPSPPVPEPSSSLSNATSGPSSSLSSETSPMTPLSNGTPGSATSESVPARLVT